MDDNQKLKIVHARTRRRLIFAGITLLLYFSFVLNWTGIAGGPGAGLGLRLGDTHITGSLLMFALLIVVFIGMELLFLLINRLADKAARDA